MKRAHLTFGLLLFVVFLITGQFMRADFPDKEAIDQSLRLLMRSRHIYILFSALIHIVLGVYLTRRPVRWQRTLQYAGSGLLIIAAGLLVAAFIRETYLTGQFSDLSRHGIYLTLAGVGLHLITDMMSRPSVPSEEG